MTTRITSTWATRRFLRLALVLPSVLGVVYGLTAIPAFAQTEPKPREKVAVLDGKVEGIAPEMKGRFYAALTEVLEGAGHPVVAPRRAQAELSQANSLLGCTMGPCLTQIGRTLGVKRVVVLTLGQVGSTYDVTLSLVETERGAPLLQASRRCDICTVEEGIGALRRAAVDLVAKEASSDKSDKSPGSLQAPRPTDGNRSQPSAAALAPTAPAADSSSSSGSSSSGDDQPWYRSRAIPYVLIGMAVAAGVAGAVLVSQDGCSTDVPPGGRCPQTHNTAGAGYGLIAGAGAFALTAVFLF